MSFRIHFRREVREKIEWIFHGARDQERLYEAMDRIHELLREHPAAESEGREGRERVLFADPLTIHFTIDPANFQVDVHRVRRR